MQPSRQFDEAERQRLAPPARQSASSERMTVQARQVEEPRATRKPAQPSDNKSENSEQEQRAKRSTKRCDERDTQEKSCFRGLTLELSGRCRSEQQSTATNPQRSA